MTRDGIMGNKIPLITVCIVNYNTSDFIRLSLYSLEKLTHYPFTVLICDNGSNWRDRRQLKKVIEKYENIQLFFRRQTEKGSVGHGEALNILVEKIDTTYGVILDADAIFLIKDYDAILINQLDDKVKIIGAPTISGTIKPDDFPLTFAVLFDTKVFKSLHIDMRPTDPQMGKDVGWQMREKFINRGDKGKVLVAKSTRKYKRGPFRNIICVEYYLPGKTQIFCSHFSRGSTLGVAKYKEWNKLLSLPYINRFARKLKGRKEKKEWLTICKKIIDGQANE